MQAAGAQQTVHLLQTLRPSRGHVVFCNTAPVGLAPKDLSTPPMHRTHSGGLRTRPLPRTPTRAVLSVPQQQQEIHDQPAAALAGATAPARRRHSVHSPATAAAARVAP
jgi:hypothetical protein